MATMTMREFLKSAIAAFGAESTEGVFAQAQIDKMDAKLAARKGTQTKAQKETAALAAEIFATFEAGVTYTAAQVAAEFGISTQKASAILKMFVTAGTMDQTEVKVKGKGKVKGYVLTDADTKTSDEGVDEGDGEG